MVNDENSIIKDNTFIGNYGAVTIEYASKCQVTGNNISEDFLGIHIIGQGGVIKGNKIIKTLYRGISLDDEREGITITDNTLSDMWGIGMELHMEKSTATNNTLYDIKGRGISTGLSIQKQNDNSIEYYNWASAQIKDDRAESDTNKSNNGLALMLLVGVGVIAVVLLVLFKDIISPKINS